MWGGLDRRVCWWPLFRQPVPAAESLQAAADAGPEAVGHLEALIRLALFFNAADCNQLNTVVTRASFPEMPSKSG